MSEQDHREVEFFQRVVEGARGKKGSIQFEIEELKAGQYRLRSGDVEITHNQNDMVSLVMAIRERVAAEKAAAAAGTKMTGADSGWISLDPEKEDIESVMEFLRKEMKLGR